MPNRIQILSDEAINQIAAGEVVDSPASVVKELVENAIDAEASKITIEIVGGGLKLIRVSDDGMGMGRDDALLSIQRHATSKIRSAHDLFHVKTQGFRGEALAAIASVSKMEIVTAEEGQLGTKLQIEKGEIVKIGSVARTRGTTIEVDSLFYCVPARKRFQKAAAAIGAEIFRLVSNLSLGHPEVGFELISNGQRSLFVMGPSSLEERAREILGQEFLAGKFPLEFAEGEIVLKGFLGSPTNVRPNRTGQHLFINRRLVSCQVLQEAIREGYGTRIDDKRHPLFLLHLSIPSDLVDVNVHPQKTQVRLREEELLRSVFSRAVEKALAVRSEMPRVSFAPRAFDFSVEQEAPLVFNEEPVEQELHFEQESQVVAKFSHYLFLQEGESLELVDLKAVHFRVIFEGLLQEKQCADKQMLLIPFTIGLTPVESAMVLTHQEAIEALGFELRLIAKDAFMVRAIPPFVKEEEVKQIVTYLASALQDFIGKRDYEKERRERLALVAAGFAKKEQFSNDEALLLLKQLKETSSPFHSPKGEPTRITFSYEAIQNLFKAHSKAAKES